MFHKTDRTRGRKHVNLCGVKSKLSVRSLCAEKNNVSLTGSFCGAEMSFL